LRLLMAKKIPPKKPRIRAQTHKLKEKKTTDAGMRECGDGRIKGDARIAMSGASPMATDNNEFANLSMQPNA
jgi:hypothetical protein